MSCCQRLVLRGTYAPLVLLGVWLRTLPAFVAMALCLGSLGTPVRAGTLDRPALEKVFPPPLVVGQKDDKLPIWPILKQEAGAYDTIGYVFESIDFAPIPGFGGSPPNLLIMIGPDGTFRSVKVLSQHEPVFVDGLGPEPLDAFVQQYVGMSARHTIRVGRPNARSAGASPTSVVDGIAMATASTRVINQEILSSALAVARTKLGFGSSETLGLRVIAKQGDVQPQSWQALVAKGWVEDFPLTNRTVEAAFARTAVAGDSLGAPDALFTHTFLAYLNVPSIGRNLLGDKLFGYVMASLAPGDHAVLVLNTGPWSPLGEDFVSGSIPDAVAITQANAPITARDLAIPREGRGMPGMPAGDWTILKISADAGFNPTRPWSLVLKVTREHGQILAEKIARDFSVSYALPASFFTVENAESVPSWRDSFVARKAELAIIVAMLLVLVPILVRQKALVARARPFALFRLCYLALTLGFIGWYAQAQLSIVTVVGVVRALVSDRDFTFLLYDPPSLLLWAFTTATLLFWGRGTFCGWLCPFGALQEFAALVARVLRLPQIQVPRRLDRRLRWLKYAVLIAIVASAAIATPVADTLVEVEPFKTAITLYFVRHWPFVVYAVGLILFNLFVYKGFCRYLCPLGATFAVGGRLRMLNWIPRRAECGTPCQLCKVKCRYGAIEPTGRIDYGECFQCMDCVTIINDPAQCVPQVLARRRGKRIEPRLAAAE